jgi:hypothetical protein
MICTASLYGTCRDRFIEYPLAARPVDRSGTLRSMVLMLQDSDNPSFFVLSQDCSSGVPVYSICPWPAGDSVDIQAHGDIGIPDVTRNIVTEGVPIPRHGSIFGWTWGDAFTSLIVIYTEYIPARPLPRWTVMPLAGSPEPQWPPFTNERLFGHWFWEHYRGRSILSLRDLIAATPDTVFWLDTQASLGSDSCAVARDVKGPDGHVLPHGSYVYYQALREGRPTPSLTTLLAHPDKTDLAPRF